tara:strand:- start:2015 stop:3826 length:1812 start_codon:yes stop_codon:yes gene_type:complete
MERQTNMQNKKNIKNKAKKNNFIISPANFLIGGLVIYLFLGYYLSSSNFSNKLNSTCEYLYSETNDTFSIYYDYLLSIGCNQLKSVLALRAFIIMFFLFGVYIWLMLIFFIKQTNEKQLPDQYKLNNKNIGFFSILSFISQISIISVIGVIMFLIIISVLYLANYWSSAMSSILFTLNIINVIVILAFIYIYFLKQLETGKTPRTIIDLVKHIVFYIPCLFISLIENLTGVYNNTSHTTAIILMIEAVIITAYFIIPIISDYISNSIGTPLLKGPVYLNYKHNIGPYESIKKRTEKRKKEKEPSLEDILFDHDEHLNKRKQDTNKSTENIDSKDDSNYTDWRCKKGLKDLHSREKCGHENISNEECVKMGCCYNNQGYNIPACYKSSNYQGETYETSISLDIPELTTSGNGHLINPYKDDKCNKNDKDNKGSKIKEDYIVDTIKFKVHTKASIGDNMPKNFNYNYGLSFWFWINPQPPSTNKNYIKFANILDYNKSPQITYKGQTNTLKVTMRNGNKEDRTVYENSEILFQKWNFMFINYDGGTLDVFLNNELVSTTKSIVPYMTHNSTFIGEENGLNGGIKNIRYFDETLDRTQISLLYFSN